MSRINTSLTRLLDIRLPIVSAPMAGAATVALALEVTRGGGFGFIAAGLEPAASLHAALASARAALPADHTGPLPLGVGFLGWALDQAGAEGAAALLDAALDGRARAVWFAFGADLGRWVRHVRAADARAGDGRRTVVFVQLSSAQDALVAAREWGVDVVVAQGNEAGGHGRADAQSVLTLVPAVLAALAPDGLPVLAAGGLVTGAQVAALLTLGAAGAVLGTRFLLTPESRYTVAQKAGLVAAGAGSTTRTMAFDDVRGTRGWPAGVDGRGLRNKTVDDLDAGVDMELVRAQFVEGVKNDDPARMVVWAGQGVSLMREIKGAKDICEEIHLDIVQCLHSAQSIFQA